MRTVAVIPAYNEAETLAEVIEVVSAVELVDEVLVISDGSTDATPDIGRDHGATVIELDQNVGKGGAMKRGIDAADADIFVLLDADLMGLEPRHVMVLVEPVLSGQADMTVGLFDDGRMTTDLAQQVAPYLSGQRAVRSALLKQVSGLEMARYGVEIALTRHIQQEPVRVKRVSLEGVTHRTKEEKLGVFQGFIARMKMYWDIVWYTGKTLTQDDLEDAGTLKDPERTP